MEKIDKFIEKLPADIARRVLATLYRIRMNNIDGMDLKKVAGSSNEYRTRIGQVRIRFLKTSIGNIIIHVGFKSDNTYR